MLPTHQNVCSQTVLPFPKGSPLQKYSQMPPKCWPPDKIYPKHSTPFPRNVSDQSFVIRAKLTFEHVKKWSSVISTENNVLRQTEVDWLLFTDGTALGSTWWLYLSLYPVHEIFTSPPAPLWTTTSSFSPVKPAFKQGVATLVSSSCHRKGQMNFSVRETQAFPAELRMSSMFSSLHTKIACLLRTTTSCKAFLMSINNNSLISWKFNGILYFLHQHEEETPCRQMKLPVLFPKIFRDHYHCLYCPRTCARQILRPGVSIQNFLGHPLPGSDPVSARRRRSCWNWLISRADWGLDSSQKRGWPVLVQRTRETSVRCINKCRFTGGGVRLHPAWMCWQAEQRQRMGWGSPAG